MSSVLGSSQSLVIATTAMVVSSTVLFLTFSRKNSQENSHPTKPILRSCLCSDKRMEKNKNKNKKKQKRVQFADDVKEPKSNGDEFRKRYNNKNLIDCRRQNEAVVNGMPANRIALYNGILRDRVNRMECSY